MRLWRFYGVYVNESTKKILLCNISCSGPGNNNEKRFHCISDVICSGLKCSKHHKRGKMLLYVIFMFTNESTPKNQIKPYRT